MNTEQAEIKCLMVFACVRYMETATCRKCCHSDAKSFCSQGVNCANCVSLFFPSLLSRFPFSLVVSKMSAAAAAPAQRAVVVFGTSQDRRLFPLYFAPDRLGNEMCRRVAPDLGPGSYDSHKVGLLKCCEVVVGGGAVYPLE